MSGALAGSPRADELDAHRTKYLQMVQASQFDDAYRQMRGDKTLSDAEKKMIISSINEEFLFGQSKEWGNHGIRRSFRFWKDSEKTEYLRRAVEIADCLKAKVSPYVSFGFGSVLGFIRDQDFIPHDDDMDLIVALSSEDATFASAKSLSRQKLEEAGFAVHGNENLSHHTVVRGSYAGTDVFLGFIEGYGSVSWFPSKRCNLRVSDVFPTQDIEMFGVKCPIPADPEAYLVATYGPDWREPIPNWNHPWDKSQYRDFIAG